MPWPAQPAAEQLRAAELFSPRDSPWQTGRKRLKYVKSFLEVNRLCLPTLQPPVFSPLAFKSVVSAVLRSVSDEQWLYLPSPETNRKGVERKRNTDGKQKNGFSFLQSHNRAICPRTAKASPCPAALPHRRCPSHSPDGSCCRAGELIAAGEPCSMTTPLVKITR